MRDCVLVWFQGKEHRLKPMATDMLLPWLRDTNRATGTKEGCNEGDCGACSVILMRLRDDKPDFKPVNACILPLSALDGAALFTVEDLGTPQALHPIQEAVVNYHGSQCGFCTPGFITTMTAGALGTSKNSAQTQIAGNLCRCTGYGGLIQAYDEAKSAPQPPEFGAKIKAAQAWLSAQTPGGFLTPAMIAPRRVSDFAEARLNFPDALIVAGATDVGLWITKRLDEPKQLLMTQYVEEMTAVTVGQTHIRIGAATTYEEAGPMILADYPEAQDWFDRLGSVQVRSSGTIGGNIANGSPIGDSPPLLIALGATLILRRGKNQRQIPLEAFFLDYGSQNLAPGEFVEAIELPRRSAGQKVAFEKISKRKDQDISSIMAAFSIKDEQHRYAFGGMAGVPKLAEMTMQSRNPMDLTKDFLPLSDQRASADYRMTVAQNLLTAFLSEAQS